MTTAGVISIGPSEPDPEVIALLARFRALYAEVPRGRRHALLGLLHGWVNFETYLELGGGGGASFSTPPGPSPTGQHA